MNVFYTNFTKNQSSLKQNIYLRGGASGKAAVEGIHP